MKLTSRTLGTAAVAALLAFTALAAMPASKHVHLSRSQPAADSTVATAPTAIKLWFSAPVQVAVTTVRVTAVDGTSMAMMPTTQASAAGSPVVATLHGPLADGRYNVAWRTMSRDGHAVNGSFAFTVATTATHSR